MEMTYEAFDRLCDGIGGWARVEYARQTAKRRFKIVLTFKNGTEHWQFTVVVPRNDPWAFQVMGHKWNPLYKSNWPLQQAMRESVEARIARELRRALPEEDDDE